MSRTLFPALAAALAAGLVCGTVRSGFAQQQNSGQRPAPRQSAGVQPAGVQAADFRVPDVSPQLQKLLTDWSKASAGITELQGEHGRIVYDNVFHVSKHAKGHFYFKGPDKGRIDLNPVAVKPGDPDPLMKDKRTGKPYTLQLDQQERWICDGKQIWRIDDTKKEAEVFPIPEEARGANIMDGPLPFLFGLPPEKAKRRFQFTIEKETAETVQLHVRPRLHQDAQNWSEARVILLKNKSYLPQAVQIFDPSGNEVTVYSFEPDKLKIGPQRNILPFWGPKDPFVPDLDEKKYQLKHHRPVEAIAPGPPTTLPSVIGLHGTRAKGLLEQLGCQVKWVPGEVADLPQLAHTVYQQQPAARTPLQQAQTVTLTYYVAPQPEQPAQQPATPAGQNTVEVPSVLGVYWKEAEANLKQAGLEVEFLQGRAAGSEQLTYVVYDQQPGAGSRVAAGEKVKLTVYLKPATAANDR
jgi:TIGR03009 family protein